jgi:hypothetical protein
MEELTEQHSDMILSCGNNNFYEFCINLETDVRMNLKRSSQHSSH